MRFAGYLLIFLLLTLNLSTPAVPQSSDKQFCPPTEDARVTEEAEQVARFHPVIDAGYKLAEKTCKGVNFLRKLFSSNSDPDQVTVDDVFEASVPDVDPLVAQMESRRELDKLETMSRLRAKNEADMKRRANPADEAVRERNEKDELELPFLKTNPPVYEAEPELVYLPPSQASGGFIRIFKGEKPLEPGSSAPASEGQINGEGVMLSADGIEKGTFEAGELEGEGQEITADGAWRGGFFEDGQLEGPGFEVREENGKMMLVNAEFRDDVPDGVAEISFEDGTSRRDIWHQGERAAIGRLAQVGAKAVTPEFKTDEQVAAEEQGQFLASLEKAGSAAALYAMADELTEQLETEKARQAYRALLRRFPDSPLAERAAAKLDNMAQSLPSDQQKSLQSQKSNGKKAQYSSVCMRNMHQLQNSVLAENKSFKFSRRYYDALSEIVKPCQTYDSEAAEEVRIKARERASLFGEDPYDPNLPWLEAEMRRALSDPNYSSSLGPFRLGPGGIGEGGGPVSVGNKDAQTGYRTFISDKILPAEIHARYNGVGLPQSTCQQQENQDLVQYFGPTPNLGTLQLYRRNIAIMEYAMAIYKQCENIPAISRLIQDWQANRAQAIENCRAFESGQGACLAPYRKD